MDLPIKEGWVPLRQVKKFRVFTREVRVNIWRFLSSVLISENSSLLPIWLPGEKGSPMGI